MTREHDINCVAKIVMDRLRADFTNVEIIDVRVSPDIDGDEDDVLRIEVVFKGKSRDLDSRIVSGAVRHIRPFLHDIGQHAFPLFSFVTQSDAGRRFEPA